MIQSAMEARIAPCSRIGSKQIESDIGVAVVTDSDRTELLLPCSAPVAAGDVVILQVTGPGEMILLSI
jgi:hypothetical protein